MSDCKHIGCDNVSWGAWRDRMGWIIDEGSAHTFACLVCGELMPFGDVDDSDPAEMQLAAWLADNAQLFRPGIARDDVDRLAIMCAVENDTSHDPAADGDGGEG